MLVTAEPQLKVKAGAPKLTADGTILFVSNEFGSSTFKPTLQASKDGGKTWTIVNDQLGFGTALWPLKSGSLISISSGQDGITTIRHSTDGGATWKTEYSSYTRL